MKKLLFILMFAFLGALVYAQSPEAFKYQAAVRDDAGDILANKSVSFRISILKGSTSGSLVYSETHNPTTNDYGLVNLSIGQGSVQSGTFSTIDWGGDTYFVRIELDENGGTNYTSMGTSQFLSVPFALYAKESGSGGGGTDQTLSITPTKGTISISSGNSISIADSSSTNELQTISKSGNTVTLTQGGGSFTDDVNDADADAANEFQTLSISGSDLTITPNGNTVALPSSLTLPFSKTYNGSSHAIDIDHSGGGGKIANFIINNSNNNATAFYVSTNGTGKAGHFNITNSSNGSDALFVNTYGSGRAANFNANADNMEAVKIRQNGDGDALLVNSTTGRAAYFNGNVLVNGSLSKSSGSFQIDHPLDPQNKYLYHSFVESPDMMNIYNGNVVLDQNGEAWINLPEWFDVLNKDFRYQVTCIGGFAKVFIAEEISGNKFKIGGGYEGLKVSWQITGIRQDPYAEQNRIQVEVEKPESEKGFYLHYKEYDIPYERSIQYGKAE